MSQDKRPLLVECPICAAKVNEPCTMRGTKSGPETAAPHNKRYIAAGIDYWTGEAPGNAPKGAP